MPLTPEEIEGWTFKVVDQGFDPDEVMALLRAVASDYRNLLDLAMAVVEAESAAESDADPDVGVVVRSRAERRQLKRARDEAARVVAEARLDAAELMQESFARIDRVLALEAGMREQLRMAKEGIEALEAKLQWPDWLLRPGTHQEPQEDGPNDAANPLDE
jgi:DivIVA domain-containing protein